VLVVEASADAQHPDLQLELEASQWHTPNVNPGGNCPYRNQPVYPFVSPVGTGSAALAVPLFPCNADVIGWTGATVEVRVRLVSIGTNPAPASIAVTVRGETRPPTATLVQQVETVLGAKQLVLAPSKDTVLYQNDFAANNGAGQFLWAGTQVAPGFQLRARRSLLAFDVSPAIPPIASVTDAELALEVTAVVGGGGPLTLYPVAPGPAYGWIEGTVDAPDPEIDGGADPFSSADWGYRARPLVAWSTPGGDAAGPSVAQTNVVGTGPIALSGPALAATVQEWVTSGADEDGFLLVGPPATSVSRGLQLTSRQHPSLAARPRLTVDYVQSEIYEDGRVNTGVVSYIDEGQDFRWIYDLDHDDVFETDVGGVCEVTQNTTPNFLPYRYSFTGTPGFTGIDCCTWHIDSPQTGTLGTGQALFFHNLDASNPANLPPDGDRDGIRDLCDNCPAVPNGPLLGRCASWPAFGSVCRSDAECGGTPRSCDLSQDDTNGDFVGNACPEPGLALGLAAGIALFAARPRGWRPTRPPG